MTTKRQCSVMVSNNTGFYSHPCYESATVERNGKWYCTIHDPEYIKAKDAEQMAIYDKDFEQRMAQIEAWAQCLLINPDNPRAVAESIGDMYEALKNLVQRIDEGLALGERLDVLPAREALNKAGGKE